MNESFPTNDVISLDIKAPIERLVIARFANDREEPRRRKEALVWTDNYGKIFEQILGRIIAEVGGETEFRKQMPEKTEEIVHSIVAELETEHYV